MLMSFLLFENPNVLSRRYVSVVCVDECCVEADVGWCGVEVGCDGVGEGVAMCEVCVDICDMCYVVYVCC